MPARFLKVVSFEGLEKHVFEDDRRTNRGQHPFSDMRYQDAVDPRRQRELRLRIVARTRAAGPRALRASSAIIGESFSEIFLGNSSVLGLPCFTADHDSIDKLQTLIETTPDVDDRRQRRDRRRDAPAR